MHWEPELFHNMYFPPQIIIHMLNGLFEITWHIVMVLGIGTRCFGTTLSICRIAVSGA